MYVVGTASPG
ncbi:Protein of unknown function, partial [Gryllus bimaculatus]